MEEQDVVPDWVAGATAACGLLLSAAGWRRGEAVRRRRKAAGVPSVDTVLMTQHDRFNLLTLPVLVVMGMCVLAEFLGFGAAWIDADVYVAVFTLYVAVDFVYVWMVPESTPQPGVILIHHGVTLMLARFPLLEERFAVPSSGMSIVEVNTLILVLQRHFAPWLLGTSTAAAVLRPGLFYLYWSTYVAIRLALQPYIAYKTVTEYTAFMGVYDAALVTILVALLCVFNVGLLGKQLIDFRNGVPLPGSLRKRESDDKR